MSWSNRFKEPVDANSCDTGIPLTPRSDADLLRSKPVTYPDIFADSLGDSSIRSKVASAAFMVETTILRPFKY